MKITKRTDDTYVIIKNGWPYHVIESDMLYAEVMAHAKNHPEDVTEEAPPAPPTLPEARAARLAELRAIRLAAEYGGFTLDGWKWDSELKDEQRLTSMVTLMKETGFASFDGWKIAEGVYIVLTFELALRAAQTMFMHYAACFAEEARIAAEISALTSVSAVEAYSIHFNIQGEE